MSSFFFVIFARDLETCQFYWSFATNELFHWFSSSVFNFIGFCSQFTFFWLLLVYIAPNSKGRSLDIFDWVFFYFLMFAFNVTDFPLSIALYVTKFDMLQFHFNYTFLFPLRLALTMDYLAVCSLVSKYLDIFVLTSCYF